MEVQTQQANATNVTPAEAPAAETTVGSDLTADFDTFLTLLTAQLRNQDPLNPVDSTEFIAQLASFSAVEQQTQTNTLLEELLAATTGNGSDTQVSSWLGQQVNAPGPVSFDGQTAAEVTLTPPEGAERATLTITNDFGLTIGTLDLDPNATSYSWNGLDAAGTLSPAGSYTLTATYFSGDALTAEVIAGSYATVTEVRFADSGTQLILDTGASVDPDDVSGLRLPQTG